MIKYCECGCGQVVKNRYVKGHQHYRMKGISHNEKYGKERAKKINKKNSEKRSIAKEKILKKYIEIYDKEGSFIKKETEEKLGIVFQTIRNKFGTLNNLAKITKRPFKKPNSKIYGHPTREGKNEKIILDIIEEQNKIKLIRQYLVIFNVGCAWVDGYDKEHNIAYEVDEIGHRFNKVQDKIRENNIKEVISNINFIRINEQDFILKNKHLIENIKNLNNFPVIKNDKVL